jgi:hypothetical protein
MRKLAVGVLAALLGAGLAGSIAVADDVDQGTQVPVKRGWSPGTFFGGKPKLDDKGPVGQAMVVDTALPERTVDVRIREQKAFLRRLQVCDRLAQIADDTKDEALMRQVEQLNQQAYDVYVKRTGGSVGGARFEETDGIGEVATPQKAKPGKRGEDK